MDRQLQKKKRSYQIDILIFSQVAYPFYPYTIPEEFRDFYWWILHNSNGKFFVIILLYYYRLLQSVSACPMSESTIDHYILHATKEVQKFIFLKKFKFFDCQPIQNHDVKFHYFNK